MRGVRGKKLLGFGLWWASHEAEALADFRQFYGIDLPLLEGLSLEEEAPEMTRWAMLFEQLPPDSRAMTEHGWGWREYLLRDIEYWAHTAAWLASEDGAKGANPPRRVKAPGEREDAERLRDEALAAKESIAAAYGIDAV